MADAADLEEQLRMSVRPASMDEIKLVLQVVKRELNDLVGPVLMRVPNSSGPGSVGLGSAVVLRIGEKLFAVTAAHNIKTEIETVFALIPKGASTIDQVVELTERRAALVGGGDQFDDFDVAIFEVSEDELVRWGVKPLPLERVAVYNLADNEFALLHGFPFTQAEVEYGGKKLTTKNMTFGTVAVPVAEWDTHRFRKGRHLLLRYPQDKGSVFRLDGGTRRDEVLPDPYGISGSGVWIVADKPGELFSSDSLLLVGIEYAWSTGGKYILANTMNVVLHLIQKAFPEVADAIDAAPIFVANSWAEHTDE